MSLPSKCVDLNASLCSNTFQIESDGNKKRLLFVFPLSRWQVSAPLEGFMQQFPSQFSENNERWGRSSWVLHHSFQVYTTVFSQLSENNASSCRSERRGECTMQGDGVWGRLCGDWCFVQVESEFLEIGTNWPGWQVSLLIYWLKCLRWQKTCFLDMQWKTNIVLLCQYLLDFNYCARNKGIQEELCKDAILGWWKGLGTSSGGIRQFSNTVLFETGTVMILICW